MGEAPHKIAFAGFRHGHIFDLYSLAGTSSALEVVAACEEHAETRTEIHAKGTAVITHDRIEQMLDEVDCDIVADRHLFRRSRPGADRSAHARQTRHQRQTSVYSDGRPRPH